MKVKILTAAFLCAIVSCKPPANESIDQDLLRRNGDSIIAATFDTLRNTLMKTVAEKGVAGAISFCNLEALNLTAAYANERVSVKRTSDRIRNPRNVPDSLEERILKAYRNLLAKGQGLIPVAEQDEGGNFHYFKPILIQSMCLNCHGEKVTQVLPETWQAILQKYPNDQAFGYRNGEMRGIWHVTFHR